MLFIPCVFHAFAYVHCCLVVKGLTSWLLFLIINSDFVTFPCGILGQVWYLIVSIPNRCRLSYFVSHHDYYMYTGHDKKCDLEKFDT